MSTSGRIIEYLTTVPPTSLSEQSPQKIGAVLGQTAPAVSKLLWSLENTGRITLIRDGRSITGVKSIDRAEVAQGTKVDSPRTRKRDGEAERPQVAAVRNIRTPLLDRYEAAKHRAASMSAGDNEFFEITFRDNPIAEEGIALKAALLTLEEKYRELASQYKMTLYQYEGVKDRLSQRSGTVAAEIAKRDMDIARDAD
jgi:hypothetical protein